MNFDIATGYRDLIFSKSVRPMEINEETKKLEIASRICLCDVKKVSTISRGPRAVAYKDRL